MDKILVVKDGRWYKPVGLKDGFWHWRDHPSHTEHWSGTIVTAIHNSDSFPSPKAAFAAIPSEWGAVRMLKVLHKIEGGYRAYKVTRSVGTLQVQLAQAQAEIVQLKGLAAPAEKASSSLLIALKATEADRDSWRKQAGIAGQKRTEAESALNAEKKRSHDLANQVQALTFKSDRRETLKPGFLEVYRTIEVYPGWTLWTGGLESREPTPLIPPAPVGALYANGQPRPGGSHLR